MQFSWLPEVALVAAGYLLGAVPFALLLGALAGTDLRRVGSGNVGAGNLTRSVGLPYGVAAAVLDGLKGLAPVVAAGQLGFDTPVAAAGGVAAVIGHNWSVYLRSRSGRGLATSVGVLVGIAPGLLVWTGLWAVAGWVIGGGLAGFFGWGLLAPVAVFTGQPSLVVAVVLVLSLVVLIRRMQGNRGEPADRRSRLVRVVWDTDRTQALDRHSHENRAA